MIERKPGKRAGVDFIISLFKVTGFKQGAMWQEDYVQPTTLAVLNILP